MKTEALKRVYLFQSLKNSELELILSIARRWKFSSGQNVFREGDVGDRFYLILTGEVRISKQVPGIGEEALAVLKPGDFFGEMALIDDSSRSADAIANQETTLLGIERKDFESLLFLNKDLAYAVLWAFSRTLCQRLREMNDKLQAMLAMRGGF